MDKQYATEREDEKTDNDILLEEVAARMQNMSEDQLEELKDLSTNLDTSLAEIRQKQRERFNTNHVVFDDATYQKKLEEQKDWQSRGRKSATDFIDYVDGYIKRSKRHIEIY